MVLPSGREFRFQEFPLQERFVSGVYSGGVHFHCGEPVSDTASGGLCINCFVDMQSSLVSVSYTERAERLKPVKLDLTLTLCIKLSKGGGVPKDRWFSEGASCGAECIKVV